MRLIKVSKPYYKNISILLKKEILKKKNKNIFLTGGNTFKKIYSEMNLNLPEKIFKKKLFYITDERINVNLKNTNYFNIYNNFFKKKYTANFENINLRIKNLTKEVIRYSHKLPIFPDLTFLSLGKYGHVASVFQKSNLLCCNERVGFKKKTNNLETRISLSMSYINKSKRVILVVGPDKISELKNFFKKNHNCPASKIDKKKICIYIYDKEYKKTFNL